MPAFLQIDADISMTDNMIIPGNLQTVCDIVIPVHNAAHWVDWCMDEVVRHDSDAVGQVMLVDDGSTDEQSELIKRAAQRFRKAMHVQTPGPDHGFGSACNYGAAMSSSKYLLFLNTDCLLTEGCIESLLASFNQDSNIVLSCPISNNSPALTFPMIPGYSYVDMNRLCKESAIGQSVGNQVLDACTVVGNCLMVRKDFFDKAGGFDTVWGKGYGEETDLHMKAFSLGLRGVVALNSYVYHYGSGTFRYEAEQEQIKKRNYSLFMSKWAQEYRLLAKQCAKHPPIPLLRKRILAITKKDALLELDVLFYLPALNQSTGGFHTVVGICNALIREGVRACCAVVGDLRLSGRDAYQEPVLFELLHYPTESHFLADKQIAPKIVVSTIYASAPIVNQYAQARGIKHIQYVQGYEAYFDGGRRYSEFVESLLFGAELITTSCWLEDMIRRHLPSEKQIIRLPLGVNEFVFYPVKSERSGLGSCPKVGAVLREAPDKGQGMVLEVLDRLVRSGNYHVVVFKSAKYPIPSWWPTGSYTLVELPAEQLLIAEYMRQVDVFLDASLHEGFGLMPLEALACGCRLVCSDSGGIREYLRDGQNGFIVREISDPEVYIHKIKVCLTLPMPKLAQEYLANHSLGRYVEEIKRLLENTTAYSEESWNNRLSKINSIPFSARLYGMLLKFYLKIHMHIPHRIQLVLRALFGKSR